MSNVITSVKDEIFKVIVGQEKMVDSVIIGLLADGHILIEGVPGLAKTTIINTVSQVLGLEFKRVQFTPDLLPSDIIGVEMFDSSTSEFKVRKGPIFSNLILADEINRAPAKVQSALLEAMAEKQVTISDSTFKLPVPFLVMATQNPLEQEGVYQLPEAQLDRFMLKSVVTYNSKEEELIIAKRASLNSFESVTKVLSGEELLSLRVKVRDVHMDEEIEKYVVDIVQATRTPSEYGLSKIAKYIESGVSPRGTIDMFKAIKAVAFMNERDFVTPLDIGYIFKDVLRHRFIVSYEARAENITKDMILSEIIDTLPIP